MNTAEDGSNDLRRHWRYIKLAADTAKFGGFNNFFIGAVIVHKHEIISVGANRFKTHPFQKKYGGRIKQYLHAEIDAIISAMRKIGKLDYATVYVARVNRVDGSFSMARPCPSCLAALADAGVRTMVYTNWEGGITIEKIERFA